ncbi:hypothetical protein HNY73_008068 [Argiope bruennichi]|uniref:Uncharacterized protein n=1 Tax=Argiope bruennichi TaxID=94029 RepID=A0A8T0FBN3_ARGBR|nr:hypothetical protein HNY73_008068 [Argiope bruennichi]
MSLLTRANRLGRGTEVEILRCWFYISVSGQQSLFLRFEGFSRHDIPVIGNEYHHDRQATISVCASPFAKWNMMNIYCK